MLSTNHALIIGAAILSIILYRRFEEKQYKQRNKGDYGSIRNYLLNESSLAKVKKPILWIHVPYEYNSRNWLSFGSRSSTELNQPYLYLTVKSIIRHCDEDFHICLIDDNSFAKIIPDWNIDMSIISDPILGYIRQLALAKLLYYYGGMVTPIDFLCFRNLIDLYNRGVNGDKMFVCENVNENITSTTNEFYPDTRFMGAQKNNEIVQQFIDFMQRTISSDFTDQSHFLGEFNRWANKRVSHGQIRLIDGKDVGVKTVDNELILVDHLLNEDYIDLYSNAYGIWIPSKNILKRTSFEWFARLSPQQVLQGGTILSKYILLASAPNERAGINHEERETLHGVRIEQFENEPNWVSFWKVPLLSDGLYGLKPNYLGNNVRKEKYQGQHLNAE